MLPACNSEAMQLHLDEIATKVTPGAHAILLLDQAGWHGAKILRVPSNITLMPLPPRAPELNGQENIWQFMRQNWLSNRVFKSFDDIVDHCCYAWNTLIDQPWKIMSIAKRNWTTVGHSRLVARLNSALRVRTLHATVMRRSRSLQPANNRAVPFVDLLDSATVLCIGRGRFYPELTTAIGERVGLIGALSVETAGHYLNARDIDGIAIGDGLGARVVDALLTVLGEDSRFRDLPVGVLGRAGVDDDRLANLVRVESDAELLVQRLLPLVRLQAFESHLQRTLKSLETEGVLDAETGLLGRDAFWRDLERAVQQAEDGGGALSVARFTFDDMTDMRCAIDAARLFSRLIRNIDFACCEQDGSILAAFTETDLRSAHVVARRIASVLRHTMLAPDSDRRAIKPTVTLATLKPSDNLSTLVARVGTYPKVAAG